MAATVVKGGIRPKRSPQSSKKPALSSPYDLTWPPLEQRVNGNIIKEMIKTFEPLSFHELLTRKEKREEHLSGGEEVEIKKEMDAERAKKLEKRSCLVIGTNEVVRALEKGMLKLLLVSRSVKLGPLFEHILILSATRKIPACAVNGMDERIPTLLGVSRVAAFGFKISEKETPFDGLVEFIKSIIPPLFVPWLHPWKDEDLVKEGMIEASVKKDAQTNSPKEESCSVQGFNMADDSQETKKGKKQLREQQTKRKVGMEGNAEWKDGVEGPPAKKMLTLTELRETFPPGHSSLPGASNGQEETKDMFAQGCSDEPGKPEKNVVTKKKRKRRKAGKWITLMEKTKTKAQRKKEQMRLNDVKLVYLRPSIKSGDTEKGQIQPGKQ